MPLEAMNKGPDFSELSIHAERASRDKLGHGLTIFVASMQEFVELVQILRGSQWQVCWNTGGKSPHSTLLKTKG